MIYLTERVNASWAGSFLMLGIQLWLFVHQNLVSWRIMRAMKRNHQYEYQRTRRTMLIQISAANINHIYYLTFLIILVKLKIPDRAICDIYMPDSSYLNRALSRQMADTWNNLA